MRLAAIEDREKRGSEQSMETFGSLMVILDKLRGKKFEWCGCGIALTSQRDLGEVSQCHRGGGEVGDCP